MSDSTEQLSLVLPLSEAETEELSISSNVTDWAEHASKHELAAAIIVVLLPTIPDNKGRKAPLVEQMMAQLIEGTTTSDDISLLRDKLYSIWDAETFQLGLMLIQKHAIGLLQERDTTAQQEMLEADSWDYTLASRIRASRNPFQYPVRTLQGEDRDLTDQQFRMATKVMGEGDEDLDLQGYAGVGKTHLIEVFLGLLASEHCLLLCFTRPQLEALQMRVKRPAVKGMTFADLSTEMLLKNPQFSPKDVNTRSASRYHVDDSTIAYGLGLQPIGSLTSKTVAEISRRAIMSFCQTVDETIQEKHLPKMADRLSRAQRIELIASAEMLWRETITPSHPEIKPPLRAYHRIKLLFLMDSTVPQRYKHIIVDESHEVPAPLLAILDRSPSATISMGDKFQKLGGFSAPRAATVRKNAINLSVRAGKQFEAIANPILQRHPSWTDLPFIGSPLRRTKIVYYDRPTLPDTPVAVLCGTEWHLIEWFQRLSHQNARFSILPGSYYSFKGLMEGCIGLFKDGARSTHPFLFRYPTWESLASAQSNNDAFKRIERMLSKGYSQADLNRSLESLLPPGRGKIILGKVEHSKNMEFDTVMLAPELLNYSPKQSREQGAKILSNIYTGASRAKHALMVPGHMESWLQDVALSP